MGPIRIVPRGRIGLAALLGTLVLGLGAVGAESQQKDAAATQPVEAARAAIRPTVASVSPAAEDMVCAIGAGRHLVGVSNFDATPGLGELPHVGDYQSIDWEKLISIRPDFLIVQMAADRVPAGLDERAAGVGARVVNVQINTIADIRREMLRLGDELNEREASRAALAKMDGRLEAVRKRWAATKPVATLIVLQEQATAAAGPGTFLDEVLTIAGGKNVLTKGRDYPSIDREQMMALSPAVIVQILPGATERERAAAAAYWKKLPELSARVVVIDDARAEMPCAEVADLAEEMATALHPGATSRAATEQ